MKKMIMLNLIAAGLLAGAANAADYPGAAAQLAEEAGFEQGVPVIGGQMMPEINLKPVPAQCQWFEDGCDTPLPFPLTTNGCSDTEKFCTTIGGSKFCFPACYLASPVTPGETLYALGAEVASSPMMRGVYQAQPAARKALAAGLFADEETRAAFAAARNVKVMADNKAAYLVVRGKTIKLQDAGLAGRARAALFPETAQQTKFWFVPAAAGAIGCMTDDACWGAVGDAVSAVSEWANS
ncbi:MAG: hypothetical protein HY952_06825 [Elusimicrobia bacterium]|nr:hypothetical protein [Elusimicrobiota bacterium]